jgi:hypothetical protein
MDLLENPDKLAAAMAKMQSQPKATHDGHTIIINNETNKTINAKWMPGMMSKHAKALMTRWCGIILLVGDIVGFKGHITPGWLISLTDEASWNSTTRAMLVNPVVINPETGRMTQRWKLDNAGFNKMVITVCHEFVHAMGEPYHDQDFINKEEHIFELVISNWARFKTLRRGL